MRKALSRIKVTPVLLLCIMGGLAIFSSTMSKNPTLPLFATSLGVSKLTLGFIASASTVVGIVVSIPAGVLSDIIGRRRVILVAGFVFASAPFFYLLVHQPWQLAVVRVYHGLATAILGPVAMAAVADTFDKGRGERMGWYSSSTMVGRFIAPLVGGALITGFGNSFHWVYVACGISGALAFLMAIRLPLSSKKTGSMTQALAGRGRQTGREILTILANRRILLTSSVEAVQYFSFGFLETFLVVFLEGKLSAVTIGLLFTIQIVAATFTKPIMGRLSDRYGRIRMIVAGLFLSGLVIVFMPLVGGYYVLLALLIGAYGLGLATTTASTAAFVADSVRATGHGTALGVLSSVMDVGQSTGPILGGALIAALSYEPAFAIIGGAVSLYAISYGLLMRRTSAGTATTVI